jgi:predicted Zn-dependent protease
MGGRNADAAYKSAYLQEKINPAAAIKIYQTNVKLFPRDARNFLRLGLIYSNDKSKLSSSVSMLRKAAALADTVPKVWLELAEVYGKLDKTDEELKAYKEYAKHDAQNVKANKRIGLILMEKGQVTNGMVYLETANALSPEDPDIMMALADGYVKTNRTKEAVDLLQKVKSKQPRNMEVRHRLFSLLRNHNRLDEALEEIEGIIKVKRDNKYLREYAELLMRMGKAKQAAERVEDILATDPENIDALMLKAMIARMEKKYDEAVEV